VSDEAARWIELLVVLALSLAVAWSFAPHGQASERPLPAPMFVR
jgi:hypothetical protein